MLQWELIDQALHKLGSALRWIAAALFWILVATLLFVGIHLLMGWLLILLVNFVFGTAFTAIQGAAVWGVLTLIGGAWWSFISLILHIIIRAIENYERDAK